MTRRTVVVLTDDLDGGPAEATVRFALDGVDYEIDLSGVNAAQLRELVGHYTVAARRLRAQRAAHHTSAAGAFPRPPGEAPGARTDRAQIAGIRAWARGAGLVVKDRGRIPARIIEAYHATGAPERGHLSAGRPLSAGTVAPGGWKPSSRPALPGCPGKPATHPVLGW